MLIGYVIEGVLTWYVKVRVVGWFGGYVSKGVLTVDVCWVDGC